jgi:hypothetical protein
MLIDNHHLVLDHQVLIAPIPIHGLTHLRRQISGWRLFRDGGTDHQFKTSDIELRPVCFHQYVTQALTLLILQVQVA